MYISLKTKQKTLVKQSAKSMSWLIKALLENAKIGALHSYSNICSKQWHGRAVLTSSVAKQILLEPTHTVYKNTWGTDLSLHYRYCSVAQQSINMAASRSRCLLTQFGKNSLPPQFIMKANYWARPWVTVACLQLTHVWSRERKKKLLSNAFLYFSYKQHCKMDFGMHNQLFNTCAIWWAFMRNDNSIFPVIMTTYVQNWEEGWERRKKMACRQVWACNNGAMLGILSRCASESEETP